MMPATKWKEHKVNCAICGQENAPDSNYRIYGLAVCAGCKDKALTLLPGDKGLPFQDYTS